MNAYDFVQPKNEIDPDQAVGYHVRSYRPVTVSLNPTALENNLADTEPGSGGDGPLRIIRTKKL